MLNRGRLVKNTVANLGRGTAAAVIALLLPPILVRHMTPAVYAVWVLVLQTAAYASYLSFGLEIAIGRYVAYSNEKGDRELRDEVFSTAFFALCCAALLSLVCLAGVILTAQEIFPSVPVALVPQMRLALLVVGVSIAIGLPASAWNGVFIGVARYEIPALAITGSRLLSAIGLIAAALAGHSLVVMAAVVASTNLLSYISQYLAMRSITPDIRFRPSSVRRSAARELYSYCLGLTAMSFSLLLITGFDLLLVGRFQFSAVVPYSVAASMITLITGLVNAVAVVLVPHAAALHAREEAESLGKLLLASTQICVLLLVLTGIPILIYARLILSFWIGAQYAAGGAPLLATLVVANMIRLIIVPYHVVLVAAGQQSYIKISPLAEGVSNLVASVVLGVLFGGIGVALGTLFGAVVAIGMQLWYSLVRTRSAIALSSWSFLTSGILGPLLCTSPLIAAAAAAWYGVSIQPAIFASAMVFSMMGAGLLVLRSHGMIRLRLPFDSQYDH